jgi:hypothetical protein
LAFTLSTSASGQSTTTQPANSVKETTVAPKPNDLESDVAAVKAENAAFREALRRMEEQQKALLEQLDRLQRKIDGLPVENPASTSPSATLADATVPAEKTEDAAVSSLPAPVPQDNKPDEDKYRDGILIWQTKDDSSIPFQLRFTNITQFRYLNTQSVNDSFTDHLGNVRTVAKRNDVGVNRSMFTFTGYIFDKRLRYYKPDRRGRKCGLAIQ